MTLNEWAYFISGIVWGGWIIRPVIDITQTIWKNAKKNSK
jgi:hypothetical protein